MIKSSLNRVDAHISQEVQKYLDAIALPALVMNMTGNVLATNSYAREAFLQHVPTIPDHLNLRHFSKIITTVDNKPYRKNNSPFHNIIKHPKLISDCKVGIEQKDQKWIYNVRLGPIKYDGKMVGVLITFRDITAEVKSRHLQETFIKVVGHELKQPLGLIKAHTYYIKKFLNSMKFGDETQYVEKIENQVNIIAQSFNDIVDATRFSLQTFSITKEPTDIVSLLLKTVEEIRTLHPQRTFIMLPTNQLTVVCDIDPVRTQQVFNNILSNAVKYSPLEEPIKIDVKVRKQWVDISVSDAGVGIDPKEMSDIFEPYFRSKAVQHKKIKGLGLGLSFVKNIMKRQDGMVSVQSKLKQGSTFILSFPLAT